MVSGTECIIKITSSENKQSWAAARIGETFPAIYTEHHRSSEGMIFLTDDGWHPEVECEVLFWKGDELAVNT